MTSYVLFAFSLLLLSLEISQVTARRSCRCLPSNDCWPDEQTWNTLNASLDGRLLMPEPPAFPCHDPHYDTTACEIAQQNWTDPFWRADQVGAMQFPNWEMDRNRSCFIDASQATPCFLGAVPFYAVEVLKTSHVQKAVQFAAEHNLRLSIKTTGHDLLGRSTAPGSFNIWMHRLKGITFHDSFIPDGCAHYNAGVSAVTAEAGVQWQELYQAADAHDVVVVGGICSSVSASGGYVQGGGHGPLSPMFGLSADNVLQLEVVTADGQLHIANECQDEDLFWALRGGGGGTFGVVISATRHTFPQLSSVVGASYVATASDARSFEGLLTKFIAIHPSLSDAGWAGYFGVAGGPQSNITITYLLPNANVSFAQNTFVPLLSYVSQQPGLSINGTMQSYSSFLDWHRDAATDAECSVNPAVCTNATGFNVVIASRLIPRKTLENSPAELARTFMDILFKDNHSVVGFFIAGGAVSDIRGKNNSVNPAWRNALWHITLDVSWADNATDTEKAAKARALTDTNGRLRDLTPGSGCYLNEADFNEPDWQQSFFGENYSRLKVIKRQVDATGLFVCRHCVGSEDWSEDMNCPVDIVSVLDASHRPQPY